MVIVQSAGRASMADALVMWYEPARLDYPAKVIIVVVAPVRLVWIMNIFETVFDTGGWRLRLARRRAWPTR
ncbi:MAG: hypothetical protein DMD89_19160 [Candidatus Rokuibacteriota bacterium]|nr:MAG: hypothetical protein DMD89_19160 [Candidatus Rokubacteria bacterium]